MTFFRALVVLVSLVLGFQVTAQEQPVTGDQPRLQVTLSDAPYVVGQPVTLRVKILVSTWMPKPPIYPNFEQPGLMVRLPEKSTHPISETVSGQTWSGTSRSYTLYPLEPGTYRIPAQRITLTYADEKAQPVQLDLTLDPIEFRTVLPEGAREMNAPVILATGFSLEQELVGTGEMAVGETITRRVTARIDGTTAILIPPLVAAPTKFATEGDLGKRPPIRAYPKDPAVDDSDVAGGVSGRRSEQITYLAQSAGSVTLPPIEIDWFNLATGTIETARLEGMTIRVAEPPAAPIGRRQFILLALAACASLGLSAWGMRVLWPKIQRAMGSLQNRWHGSEHAARRAVKRAIRAQDPSLLMTQLKRWRQHYPNLSPGDLRAFDRILARLGEKIYGAGSVVEVNQNPKTPDTGQEWNAIARQFKVLCYKAKKHDPRDGAASILPDLNP